MLLTGLILTGGVNAASKTGPEARARHLIVS